jgi:crotonobetainyl-CoA:carnitine CoA-transferase CaiB-like acyl-CoA transferase
LQRFLVALCRAATYSRSKQLLQREKSDMTGPLEGIRVLDLSRILAGPWAGQTLADLGAEVIKVERPGSGDDTRGWGPPFLPETADGQPGDAAYFLSANRGKASVCIDMSAPDGQDLIRKLACQSDILLENFKVGGLGKYGLDYDSLKELNPRLIFCSITGFGQTGPYKHRAGYDFMIQGMGGIMSVTGQPDGAPGAEPMKCGVAFADLFTGLYSVIGLLGALPARAASGRGQHIDMALLDTQVGVLANQALNYLVGGTAPPRLGNAHPNIVPYQALPTSDGFVIIAIGTNRQFAKFCEIAGLDGLPEDPRFVSNQTRVVNRDQLIPLIAEVLATRTTEDWITALEKHAIPCGPILDLEGVFSNPQVEARGLHVDIERASGEIIPGVANPIRYSETTIEYARPSPALGEDTRDVLTRVAGLDDGEIDRLAALGIIATQT